MKQRHLAGLLREDYTTVAVSLSGSEKTYTYKALRTMAATLVPGDRIVVPGKVKPDGSQGLSIGTVVLVHAKPDIDFDAEFEYAWIIQKVDLVPWQFIVAQEKQFNEELVDIEPSAQRARILENYKGSLPAALLARFEAVSGTLKLEDAKVAG